MPRTLHLEAKLLRACELGDIVTAIHMVEQGANVEAAYEAFTPLYTAASRGHSDIVSYLLAAGARDKTYGCQQSITALAEAAKNGHLAVVSAFMDAGFSAHVCLNASGFGLRTPLEWAARQGHTECVRALIAAGNDETGHSTDGALSLAAENGHVDCVRVILESGMPPNFAMRATAAPLHVAAAEGHAAVVALLLESGKDVDLEAPSAYTALMSAAQAGHEYMVAQLIEAGADVLHEDPYGMTVASAALSEGHTRVVAMLVKAGAEPPVDTRHDETKLCHAASHGDIEFVTRLLRDGVPVDCAPLGNTPLMQAAITGKVEVMNILLQHGACPQEADNSDLRRTPLSMAALHNQLEAMRILLASQSEKTFLQYPLSIAAREGHIEAVQLLLHAGANVNGTHDESLVTPLMGSCWSKDNAILPILLAAGAHVDATCEEGETALTRAATDGCITNVAALLAAGAHVHVNTKRSTCALACAIQQGHHDIVEMLSDAGAHTDSSGYDCSQCPVELAASLGRSAMVVSLLQRGVGVVGASCQQHEKALQFGARGRADMERNVLPYASALAAAVKNGHALDAALLLDAGAGIPTHPSDKQALMLSAIKSRSEGMVAVLLGAGASCMH